MEQQGIDALGYWQIGHHTELLVLLVLRPAIQGPLLAYDVDVDKACISELLVVSVG